MLISALKISYEQLNIALDWELNFPLFLQLLTPSPISSHPFSIWQG